jgi:hypothetical protein
MEQCGSIRAVQKVTVPENPTNRKEYKVLAYWSCALTAAFQGTGDKNAIHCQKWYSARYNS